MSNSDIEQTGTVKGHIPNRANLSGRISNVVSLSGNISIGSGSGDFIIKMTIEVNGNNYTVTSCDKTMEQIDAAVASGQNIKAIAFDKYVMPMTQMEYGESYTFGAFIGSFLIAANVYKNPESGTDDWEFYLSPITADIVEYSNDAMPRISTVEDALNELVPKSHSHANKEVLDKFSETDGKPVYNGEALGRDFVIKMTVEFKGSELIVTSCDTTVEQIDEAVVAEKRVALVASVDGTILELPMVQGNKGYSYYFCAILSESVFLSSVYKIENTSDWSFGMIPISRDITAEDVGYPNSFGEGAPENVGQALDVLITGFNATRKDILRLNKSEHTHYNKSVLDKFAETDGKPTYDGEALGSDFIIEMTVESHDEGYYTVTSCDATIQQIDAAVAAEKRVILIATDTATGMFWELPIVQAYPGATYIFIAYTYALRMMATVYKSGENDIWEFVENGISAEAIDYFNSTQPDVESVHAALNKLFTNSHTHANKDTLDKLSVSNGKLQYNGSDVGAKEQLTGTTSELTPTQVYDAVSAGIPVKVQYLHDVYGLLSFTAFNIAESFNIVVSQTIVYYNGAYILAELNGHKSENRWGTLFTTLAEKTDIPDIPMTLPNPHAITFTGAVTGNYDGSTPMTVNIPSAVTDEHINSLIDTKLGVIENGSY